ncbi:hypothetical protein AJ87_30055 [Rhizobium yanglingense]|nr:hypothetical protein AJ87_30055 [Rhizobium yanglingense]
MNMIRVWGGGFYEHDWFYDLCDRLGLMVWQDFMFACNLYPSTEDFLDDVALEVDYQVKRLASHPSIALWCGDNELVGALTWFDESKRDRDRYLVSYDRLNRTIEQAMKKAAPGAIWWPSSPASGYLDFGDAWHADGSGDMHYWSVWHENKSFDNYRSVRPRFCSEFGFQSYTSLPVIKTYADKRDLNIASPVMELHQKNAGGNERIAGTMFRYFRFPKDFPNFVYLSQIQQGLAIKTAVEYWRSLKPHCMGTIYWQLNDTWPVGPGRASTTAGAGRRCTISSSDSSSRSPWPPFHRRTAKRSDSRWSTTRFRRSAPSIDFHSDDEGRAQAPEGYPSRLHAGCCRDGNGDQCLGYPRGHAAWLALHGVERHGR